MSTLRPRPRICNDTSDMIRLRVTTEQADHVRRWLHNETDVAPERDVVLHLLANAVADADSGVSYHDPLVRAAETRPVDELRHLYASTWVDVLASFHLRWQPDAIHAAATVPA